jgi:hypothetical protein
VRGDLDAWPAPHARRLADLVASADWPPVARGGCAGWLDRDVAFDVYWLATGQEERRWAQDKHGFYAVDAPAAEALFTSAPSSASIAALGRLLVELGLPQPAPAWPGGKRVAAAITHDVDYPEVIRWLEPLRVVARQGPRGFGPALAVASGQRRHWHFESWQDLECDYGARSAFYFVARKGSLVEYAAGTPDSFYDAASPRFRTIMRKLVDDGWEVGLHASYLAYQSRERFAAEKRRIEDACGGEISGNRHHYWHMNPADVEETLLMHEQVGFKYDSSLAHNRHIGWRRGLSTPFFPFHHGLGRELDTLQLPVAWMDAQLFGHPVLSPEARHALLAGMIDRTAEHGGMFMINIHDYVFDERLFPGWVRALRGALDHIRARGDFWLATPAEIAGHWRERYGRLLAGSHGLAT